MQTRNRLLPVLLAASLLPGCASTPDALDASARAQLGTVYLHNAGPTRDTWLEGDFPTGGVSGAMKGAGQGAASQFDRCLGNALSAGGLGPLVLLVCTPIMVPAGLVSGSAAGSEAVVTQEAVDEMTRQADTLLQQADLSGALVYSLDEASQRNARLTAYEITHNTLPAPAAGETVYAQAARWGYTTVMDVQVTEAGFNEAKGRVPMLTLALTARVRLVTAANGDAIYDETYTVESPPQPYKYWFMEDQRTLARAITEANRVLTQQILTNVFLR